MQDSHATPRERRIANVVLTFLRLLVGGIFVAHGWQKLADVSGTVASFTRVGVSFPEASTYLAIAGEFVGGLGLVLGVVTSLAAWGPIVTSAFAIYYLHAGSGFSAGGGGWEYPLTLLSVCLYFATKGPGPHSIDAAIARERPRFRRSHRHVVTSS